jgi:hypothetical protein
VIKGAYIGIFCFPVTIGVLIRLIQSGVSIWLYYILFNKLNTMLRLNLSEKTGAEWKLVTAQNTNFIYDDSILDNTKCSFIYGFHILRCYKL